MLWRLFAPPVLLAYLAISPAFACDGTLYTGSGDPVVFDALEKRASETKIVMFGERHGVEEHVKAAACLFGKLSQSRSMGLVMEHLHAGQQQTIETFRKDHPETPEGLGAALKWWQTGWPAWNVYEPIIRVAFASRSPLVAGDLAADVNSDLSASSDILAGLRAEFGENFDKLSIDWTSAMKNAHCGLIDDDRAERLGYHQINRDLSMARAIGKTVAGSEGVMLLAGRAHVRKDRGVLAKLMNDKRLSDVISIAAVTRDEFEDARKKAGPDIHDFYWVAGESSEPACAGLKSLSRTEDR